VGDGRGEIAVGAAAGRKILEGEADLGGKGFGALEQRGDGGALLIGSTAAAVVDRALFRRQRQFRRLVG
jgi:hypothetical protein